MHRAIGRIFMKYLKIEWIRVDMYFPNDIYACFPMLVLRFSDLEDALKVKKLCQYIEKYEGKNKWSLFKSPLSKNGNYILTLRSVEQIQKEYIHYDREKYNLKNIMGQEVYELKCREAISDIEDLVQYLLLYFDGGIK